MRSIPPILPVIFMPRAMPTCQAKGAPQKQLSKEFVRQWLISNGFQGLEGQNVPIMSDPYINSVSERYIELYENITGESFVRQIPPKSPNAFRRMFWSIWTIYRD